MPENNEEIIQRLTGVEKAAAWLQQRVWDGVGNLHDRVHILEDRNGDRVHEITNLQADVAKIERVLGLDGYGDKSIINDLRDALDTIAKLKEGIISVKDFQALMHDVEILKKRGQAQISLWNYIAFGVIGAAVNFLMLLVMTRLFSGGTP
jgi:hypothetical protein